MLIKAVQKNTRQAPRKVRLIANTVKKLPLEQALKQLAVIERKATVVVGKVVRQAVADAMNNHGYQFSDLLLDSITVNEGPRYRRFQAVSRGRAHGITKRTCHITVVLRTMDEVQADSKKVAAAEKLAPAAVEKKEVKTAEKKAPAKKAAAPKKTTKKETK
jgi:large subunit ribosomal protein L22